MIKKYNQFLNEKVSTEIRFVVDKFNQQFKVFLGDVLVSYTHFGIDKPDRLFNKKYVSLLQLNTIEEFKRKGYAKYLLENIFDYVKNELNIDSILLNVYKKNEAAVKLYFNLGFEVYKDYDGDDYDDGAEYSYYTLIKKLN